MRIYMDPAANEQKEKLTSLRKDSTRVGRNGVAANFVVGRVLATVY